MNAPYNIAINIAILENTMDIGTSDIAVMTASSNTIVTGTLYFELEDETLLPLRQTKVELRDKEPIGSRCIATTYTDNDGRFTFNLITLTHGMTLKTVVLTYLSDGIRNLNILKSIGILHLFMIKLHWGIPVGGRRRLGREPAH